jgi:hypothetical protein
VNQTSVAITLAPNTFAAAFEKLRTKVLIHTTPEQAHLSFHPQRQLRGDGGEVPFAWHAFERVIASVFELKS